MLISCWAEAEGVLLYSALNLDYRWQEGHRRKDKDLSGWLLRIFQEPKSGCAVEWKHHVPHLGQPRLRVAIMDHREKWRWPHLSPQMPSPCVTSGSQSRAGANWTEDPTRDLRICSAASLGCSESCQVRFPAHSKLDETQGMCRRSLLHLQHLARR